MKQLKKKFMRVLRKRMPHVASALRFYRSEKRLDKPFSVHPDGFRFKGHPSMESGAFEPEEAKLFARLVECVDTFVNVGANIGYYTCMAAHRGKRVVAFEPVPENARLLMENIAANEWKDVEVFPLALGNKPDIAPMFGTGTGASLVEGWAGIPSFDRRFLPVNTFDNLLTHRSGLLKGRMLLWIDVEGFEYEVLQGASELLEAGRDDIWMVEICIDEHMPAGIAVNPRLTDIFELFWNAGFGACEANMNLRPVARDEILEISRTGKNRLSTHNFVFMNSERREGLK